MADFFNSVLSFFESIGNFLHMILSSITGFFGMLGSIFSDNFTGGITRYFPSFIVPFLFVGLTLLVIKVILELV